MANEELIALLNNLLGQGAGRTLNPGLLAPAPSLVAAAAETTAVKSNARSAASAALNTLAGSTLRAAGGGLTLLPVVSGLLKLFGAGQKKDELPALEKFELPAPIRAEAGLSQSGETGLVAESYMPPPPAQLLAKPPPPP